MEYVVRRDLRESTERSGDRDERRPGVSRRPGDRPGDSRRSGYRFGDRERCSYADREWIFTSSSLSN